MTVKVYTSTDTDAPTLAGLADSLNLLLLACLVTGYGSKPGAGWTSPYYDSANKVRVFLTGGSPAAYLQVKDNGPGAGSHREARMRGYELMGGYDNGTGLFPTLAQQANGVCVRKSATLDTTPRVWTVIADASHVYIFIETGDVALTASHTLFGAMRSDKPGDLYPFVIAGRISENSALLTAAAEVAMIRNATIASTNSSYLTRSYTGIGSAVLCGFYTDTARALQAAGAHCGTTGMAYPCPADGGLYMGRSYVNEANIPRGDLPGLWCPCHVKPLAHRDTFSGVEGLTGRSFLALNAGVGQIFVEISDTWDL